MCVSVGLLFAYTTFHLFTDLIQVCDTIKMTLPLKNVLIVDGIHQQCGEMLRGSGINVTELPKPSPEQLASLLQTHDALLVRSSTRVTSELLDGASRLRLVGRAGTGVDNIDLAAATGHGVLVVNTPGGNTISAAEHTCTLIAALSRNLYTTCNSLKQLQWKKKTGSELYDKVLAVIGLGRIGREVASRMKSFGMKIIGFDPVVSAEAAAELGIEKRELDEIWSDADYITVHTPLIPQTKNLLNGTTLSRCKRGVRVVNVARGGIVDETALLEALESGQCGGAALDVYVSEPQPNPQLLQHPAVICTPHIGANTEEAQRRVAVELAEQIIQARQTGELAGLVNATFLSGALRASVRPWLQLAQCLGAITRQLVGISCISKNQRKLSVQVVLSGDDTRSMVGFLGQAVLLGLTSGVTTNGINLVNAPEHARHAGIVAETKWKQDSDQSTVVVKIVSLDGVTLAMTSGSVQATVPTLLQLDTARFDGGMALSRNILFLKATSSHDSSHLLLGWLSKLGSNLLRVNFCSNHGGNESQQSTVLAVQTSKEVPIGNDKPPSTESLFQIDFDKLAPSLMT